MTPEEIKRKWSEIPPHLEVEDHGNLLTWTRANVDCSLVRTETSVTYTETAQTTRNDINQYTWDGLTAIGWLTENRVSLVFEIDDCKTVVVFKKDRAPEIDGALPLPTRREGIVS